MEPSWKRFFFIFVINSLTLKILLCQNITDTEKLYSRLQTNYNKNTRGNTEQKNPTEIGFVFQAGNLVSFDEVTASFSLSGLLYIVWKDTRMTWNETEYNGVSSITFPQNDVWIPTITLGNSMAPGGNLYLGDNKLLVRYTSDGMAYWFPGHLFKSFCAPDVRHFPFDRQVRLLCASFTVNLFLNNFYDNKYNVAWLCFTFLNADLHLVYLRCMPTSNFDIFEIKCIVLSFCYCRGVWFLNLR